MAEQNCSFCENVCEIHGGGSFLYCRCPNCGEYRISGEARADLPYYFENKLKNTKHLIAGYLRESNELKLKPEIITNENIYSILASGLIPRTLGEKLNKLLSYIYLRSGSILMPIEIQMNCPAIAYAVTEDELAQMIMALQESLLIKGFPSARTMGKPVNLNLTIKGIEKAESLLTTQVASTQCFVAMWFSEEMHKIYENYISKAISDAGYKALIISQKEHNDKICDEIIAEIRKSRFIVADFTAHRGGVYFEAGFAYGLGTPVIWTCRKDHLDQAHFDVNHYNFVVWETGDELYSKLLNRIKATIF